MTEGQRRLLAAGGVAALIWWLSRSPKAQADVAALYRALTQGLGGAPGPSDGAVGVGGGPATDLLAALRRLFTPAPSSSNPSGGGSVFRFTPPAGSTGILAPGTTPSQIVGYISQAVQNGYKAFQQITTPDSLLNKGVDYVKSFFDAGTSAATNITGGTVGGDVLGTGASTVTAPDVLLPVGPPASAPVGDFLAGGSEAFDPFTVAAPAPLQGSGYIAGGVGDAVPAVDVGAGAVEAAGTGAEIGGATVGAGATGLGEIAGPAIDAAAAASEAVSGVTAGAAVVVAAALAYWQTAEQKDAHYFVTFPMAVKGTEDNIRYAIAGGGGDPLSARLARVKTKQELADELGGFKFAIEAGGVGGYTSQGNWYQLGPLPGAGGSAHEGGVVADYTQAQEGLQTYINALAKNLPGPEPTAVDNGSTKYQAALATYTRVNYDPALGDRSQFTAYGSWQTYVASTTGKPLVVGTVQGTDTLKTITVPPPVDPNVYAVTDPNDVTAQYASAGVMAGNAPQGGGF